MLPPGRPQGWMSPRGHAAKADLEKPGFPAEERGGNYCERDIAILQGPEDPLRWRGAVALFWDTDVPQHLASAHLCPNSSLRPPHSLCLLSPPDSLGTRPSPAYERNSCGATPRTGGSELQFLVQMSSLPLSRCMSPWANDIPAMQFPSLPTSVHHRTLDSAFCIVRAQQIANVVVTVVMRTVLLDLAVEERTLELRRLWLESWPHW